MRLFACGRIAMSNCLISHSQAELFFTAPRVGLFAQALFGRWLALFMICAAGAPQATRANSEPSLWYHNGSVLYLVARGTLRGISLQRTASRNVRGRRYVRVRFCFGVNDNSGSLAMLAAMRRWYGLIREGHSSRSRDGNGRA
jgi:hypothetical protein